MNHLKQLLNRPLANVSTGLVIAVLVVALIGFADSAYLTVEHYRGVVPPCTTGGCNTVLLSSYSTIAGVPVALMGAIYYALILIAVGAFMEARMISKAEKLGHYKLLRAALIFTVAGFLMSLWFLYVQAFILHAFCQYCLLSAVTSTTLFVLAIVILCKNKNEII